MHDHVSVLTREWEIENRKMTEEGENQDSLSGKKNLVCIMRKCTCASWVLTSTSDLQAETRFTPAEDSHPRHSEICHHHILVSLSLSDFQGSYFHPYARFASFLQLLC